MRHSTLAVLAVTILAACGGSEKAPADSAAAAALPNAAQAPGAATAAAPAEPVVPAPAGTAAPITGTIFEVKMIGDAKGYRFDPAHITAKAGDGVKFVVISGGPHEVAFDLDVVPAETKLQLLVNMPNGANGRSPLLSAPQETWTLSLGGLKPGKYPFFSTPRLPQGMKGEIEIR
jgi:plastocyanin